MLYIHKWCSNNCRMADGDVDEKVLCTTTASTSSRSKWRNFLNVCFVHFNFWPLQTFLGHDWWYQTRLCYLAKSILKFKSLSMSLSQGSNFQTNQAAGTLLIKLVQPGDLRSKKDPCCFSPFAMMISIWAARILALSAQCNSWNFNSLLINQGITFS